MILAASPRKGNSLLAALEFCRGLDAARNATPARQGAPAQEAQERCAQERPAPVQLRHYRVLPCRDCGACERTAAQITPEEFITDPAALCPLSNQDDSRPLLNALAAAPLVAFCSPIYFYHLPAQLKALLDRCQIFYRAAENPALVPALNPLPRSRPLPCSNRDEQKKYRGAGGGDGQPRPFFALLLGARPQGDKLFEGSLLSLKYALAPLGFAPQPPLLLYGLDRAADLSARPDVLETIREYGRQAKY